MVWLPVGPRVFRRDFRFFARGSLLQFTGRQLAGHLAFEIALWHEIAQWYGFQSVPGFSEEISAFSPEDLYSNL
ncbi:hypothetical protein BV377_29140, partial [Klebsiella pneumoniae]